MPVRRPGPRVLAALIAVVVPGACSDDSGAPTAAAVVIDDPPAESGFPADWTPGELDWAPCEQGAPPECATLAVPLDWDDPDGAQLDLAIARTRATGSRIGNLFTNPGGPGASGVSFLSGNPLGGELGSHFDVVSWDPRGVGTSSPLECDAHAPALYAADPTPDSPGERAARSAVARQISSDCAAASGMLAHMNTEESARDMEAIRLALGGEELSYIGFSYGTHLGQEYAQLFGDRVRAMVLDGVVDPSLGFEEFLVGQAAAFESSLARQHEACEEAGPGSCGVEDLTGALDQVLADAEASSSADPGRSGLTPAEVVLAATYAQYLDQGATTLGSALSAALRGDPDPLAALASSYVALADYGPYAAVVCTDSEHPVGEDAYEEFTEEAVAASGHFGATVAAEMLPCATWAVPPQDTARALDAPDAPPVLVVGNTGDPATPLENAEAVADALASGVLVVVDREGHVAHGTDACATALIDRYLVDLEVPADGSRC